jgi:hypothetical protein
MKWLIVADTDSARAVSVIQDALKRHKATSVVWNVDTKRDDADNDTQNALNATHAIVLNAHSVLADSTVLFFTGYLTGKQVPLFFTGALPPGIYHSPQNHRPFACTDALLDAIKQDFPQYIAEEKKQIAHNMLFKEGVPFTPDFFAFHIAANHERLCRLFVAAGLDVNCRDAAGTPMLCMAARHNRKELLEWLIVQGADINAVSKDRGYTAVMDAVWKTNTAIIKTLVEKKADLNTISRDGQSVLVLAVGTGNEEICRLLAENGADPNVKDAMGMSAIQYAHLFKKDAIAAVLEKYAK